jgi:hypothetical protein
MKYILSYNPFIQLLYSTPKSPHLSLCPRNLHPNLTQALQLAIPQFHRTKLDHPRIQTQRLAHIILYVRGSVIAHDEVMPFVIDGLVFAGALWEGRNAPVGEGADRAV